MDHYSKAFAIPILTAIRGKLMHCALHDPVKDDFMHDPFKLIWF